MSFDFDDFINKPSIQIFGRITTITPANDQFAPFEINGDFHENYQEVTNKATDAKNIENFFNDLIILRYPLC